MEVQLLRAALLDADLAETEGGSMLGKFVVRPFGDKGGVAAGVTEREAELLAAFRGQGPAPAGQGRPTRGVAVMAG